MSWSTNWPHCINIRVYFSLSLRASVDTMVAAYLDGSWEMVATETSLAEGRPAVRGVSTPSSYSGGSSL